MDTIEPRPADLDDIPVDSLRKTIQNAGGGYVNHDFFFTCIYCRNTCTFTCLIWRKERTYFFTIDFPSCCEFIDIVVYIRQSSSKFDRISLKDF